MRITVEISQPRPRAWSRRRWLAGLIALTLLVPTAALASHNFTDVPSDHTFHGDIADAYAARLTAGCSPTTFCPDASVTRGQMTAFLNRGLGRLAHAGLSGTLSSGTPTTLGTVTIKAGNVTGGQALVFVSASVNAYTSAAGCPCEIRLDLHNAGGADVSPYVVADLPAIPAGDNDTDVIVSIQGYAVVPTGIAQTFSVQATRTLGTATLLPYGSLDAQYFPFDSQGNAVGVLAPAGEEDHPRD